MQVYPFLSPCTKLNSKWIKDLNLRPYTIKMIEKKMGNNLELIGIGKDFLNKTSIAQELRITIMNGLVGVF